MSQEQKEAARIRKQNQRKRDTEKMSQTDNVTQSVTNAPEMSHPDVTPQHPVLKYLIPGKDRTKMEAIVQSLTTFKQLDNVQFGCGDNPLSMEFVGELLETTAK